ncbi:hypothetical protein Fmac_030398 [Flemingia macrophylla]|uniref:Uncharacterized protein n=1 Tax=Flemingia macrophylla TaxID=520843 RepID=A0ABD1KZ44_9FABA
MKRNCHLPIRPHSSTCSPSHCSMQALTFHYELQQPNGMEFFFRYLLIFQHFCRNETLNIHNKLAAILRGRQCIFDTAELKARVIIWLANGGMEESTGLHSQALLIHVSRGLSMKNSLQNFLQRRKKRSQSNISIDKN